MSAGVMKIASFILIGIAVATVPLMFVLPDPWINTVGQAGVASGIVANILFRVASARSRRRRQELQAAFEAEGDGQNLAWLKARRQAISEGL